MPYYTRTTPGLCVVGQGVLSLAFGGYKVAGVSSNNAHYS